MKRLRDRFEVQADGCWRWVSEMGGRGYGLIEMRGIKPRKRVQAHRFVYEKVVGPIPEGMDLDHLCRNRRCVNPAHLEPVPRAENVRRGAQSVMTWEKVGALRASSEPTRVLAEQFGISKTSVRQIRRGVRWAA